MFVWLRNRVGKKCIYKNVIKAVADIYHKDHVYGPTYKHWSQFYMKTKRLFFLSFTYISFFFCFIFVRHIKMQPQKSIDFTFHGFSFNM